jgi:hypothetical protein
MKEFPRYIQKETDYCSVDREGDPSLATFAKASAAEALGMTPHLFDGGGRKGRDLPLANITHYNQCPHQSHVSVLWDLPLHVLQFPGLLQLLLSNLAA